MHGRFYSWKVAAPLIISNVVFQRSVTESCKQELINTSTSGGGRTRWFNWSRRPVDDRQSASESLPIPTGNEVASDEDIDSFKQFRRRTSHHETRTTRLTNEQIKALPLNPGSNTVVFSVTSQFQGTVRCYANIYVWDYDERIVISDIDGTITRSDIFGHVLPKVGKDWTQPAVVQLYNRLHHNGYSIIYLSARAIGMAGSTKYFLSSIRQEGLSLPDGPLLLSPSSLLSAFHREVIEKKPELFKIECLEDIRRLFPSTSSPFYAGFGNRPNDAISYRSVNIPPSRIFIINHKGGVRTDKGFGICTSYSSLFEQTDQIFPPLARAYQCSQRDLPLVHSDHYSLFTYWQLSEPKEEELVLSESE